MNEYLEFLQIALPEFYAGTLVSIRIAAVGLTIGTLVGLPVALARVYGTTWLRRSMIAYIELFRGTPLLVQLFIVYYGLPDVGLTLSRFGSAYLVLGLNSGAYQAEYFRGAIQAISSGQMTAARAIGMTRLQAIRHIIIPQAIRLVLPAWSNEGVSIIKYTAVVFLIAVPDLMTKAKILSSRFFNPVETYLTVAVVYIILVAIATLIVRLIEQTLTIPGFEVGGERSRG